MTDAATDGPDRLRLLRLGRGAGYLRALGSGDDAVPDLLACVLDDPRWDRQIDEREFYYAALLIALDGDLSPLRDRLLDDESGADRDYWLPIGVLAEMVRRGSEQARDILAEAIGRGARWRVCLDALEALGGAELVAAVATPAVVTDLVRNAAADDLADAARMVAAPWEAWADVAPALRFVLEGRNTRHDPPRLMSGPIGWIAPRIRTPDPSWLDPSLSAAELMARATTPEICRAIVELLDTRRDVETTDLLLQLSDSGTDDEFWTAAVLLGRRGCPDLLDAAEAFLRAEIQQPRDARAPARRRNAYLRYLEALPAELTLARARSWFSEAWPLRTAGEHVLAWAATGGDREMLEGAGAGALETEDMYHLCAVIEALATIGSRRSVPFLAAAYGEAPYSFARRLAVEALLPHATDATAQDLLVEALWDCECRSRELACAGVDKSDLRVRRRLKSLGEDEFEEACVRDAARDALGVPA